MFRVGGLKASTNTVLNAKNSTDIHVRLLIPPFYMMRNLGYFPSAGYSTVRAVGRCLGNARRSFRRCGCQQPSGVAVPELRSRRRAPRPTKCLRAPGGISRSVVVFHVARVPNSCLSRGELLKTEHVTVPLVLRHPCVRLERLFGVLSQFQDFSCTACSFCYSCAFGCVTVSVFHLRSPWRTVLHTFRTPPVRFPCVYPQTSLDTPIELTSTTKLHVLHLCFISGFRQQF